MRARKSKRKVRPANEFTENDVSTFLAAVKNFEGYPKLKDLGKLLPSLNPVKINTIVRYLERSGTIAIDTDGYIIWVRKEGPEQLTLGEVAEISSELREYLKSSDSSQ